MAVRSHHSDLIMSLNHDGNSFGNRHLKIFDTYWSEFLQLLWEAQSDPEEREKKKNQLSKRPKEKHQVDVAHLRSGARSWRPQVRSQRVPDAAEPQGERDNWSFFKDERPERPRLWKGTPSGRGGPELCPRAQAAQ